MSKRYEGKKEKKGKESKKMADRTEEITIWRIIK
jgi:hypothetical protein